MKRIHILTPLFVGLALLAIACDEDRDSNPTLLEPTTFVLNTPAYASSNLDLRSSTTLELTCTQPHYGYTAAVVYAVQVSLTDTWDEATETTPATYATLETTYTNAKIETIALELTKGIVKAAGWKQEADCPTAPIPVYVRLQGYLNTGAYLTHSNSVKLSVVPYYVELVDAIPATYYLLGACIGDGSWTNSFAGLGVSMVPMALVEDIDYDKATGKGTFAYTGYFPADKGFKIIGKVGDWEEQWGNAGANGANNLVHNDGGSSHILMPSAGWYTVTLNSKTNTLTLKEVTLTPKTYATMELVGGFNNWANDGVAPLVLTKTAGENSHVWYAEVTFDAAGECKFRDDSGWANNWGGSSFPLALTNGNNIPYKAGTYTVVFNDLNTCYYFIEKPKE